MADFPKLKLKSEKRITAEKVIEIYNLLSQGGVTIWVDGGWGVDALLSEQTREHTDLDIAVDQKDEQKIREILVQKSYKIIQRNAHTDAQYVMSDGQNDIDVHVFSFDEDGNNIFRTKYSKEALTGTGKINGQEVRCISPELMVQYHTRYEPSETDWHDVLAICKKFSLPIPEKFQK